MVMLRPDTFQTTQKEDPFDFLGILRDQKVFYDKLDELHHVKPKLLHENYEELLLIFLLIQNFHFIIIEQQKIGWAVML